MRLPHSVTRLRGSVIPGGWATGGQSVDWSSPDELLLSAFVQPDRETEQSVDEQSTTTLLRVVTVPGADVVESDRMRWRGADYDVLRVEPWDDLPGRSHHVEILMRAVAYAVG